MTDLSGTARVAFIGTGATGASCLIHLARVVWSDSLLLKKNEMTAGSTRHVVGNVATFPAGWSVMNMRRGAAELCRGLAAIVWHPMNCHVAGSISLAHSGS